MKLSETLRKASQIQLRRGLASSVFEDGNGCVCMQGAINAAITGKAMLSSRVPAKKESECRHAGEYLAKALRGNGLIAVYDYSDNCKNKEQAASALENAAEKAESEGL